VFLKNINSAWLLQAFAEKKTKPGRGGPGFQPCIAAVKFRKIPEKCFD
jgi:hypothetical protein